MGEKTDRELYDVMNTIWKAYREGNMKAFNACFAPLYEKYTDDVVVCMIKGMGLGLSPAATRREYESKNKK